MEPAPRRTTPLRPRTPTICQIFRSCWPPERGCFPQSLFVPIESERRLYFLVLTRFLHANRYPPRIKSGAGFRSKTLRKRRGTMIFDYTLAGLVSAGLLFY